MTAALPDYSETHPLKSLGDILAAEISRQLLVAQPLI